MKYHLDTIPVWDAFHEDSECPICILKDKSEKSYVDSFLGGSVMEPDTRIAVNEKGFCPRHNELLYKAQNRLGLALMTHTHTLKTMEKMKKVINKLEKTAKSDNGSSWFKSGKGSGLDCALKEFSEWMISQKDSCIICDRIDYSINRYVYTLLHLWGNDSDFQKVLENSKGFCFSHLPTVLDMASDTLNTKKQRELLSVLLPLQVNNMDRQEKELKWFTLKFDYRNQDKPWENSKDSLPRLLQRLTGKYME